MLPPYAQAPDLIPVGILRLGLFTTASHVALLYREAARLQSFPDWFEFDPTIWHGFRQVGNAVPPNLARAVALKIAEALETLSALKPIESV